MEITKKELEQAFDDLNKKFGGKKEDYFALLYLSKKFEQPVEGLNNCVAFEGNDYGIDAFYIDTQRRNLYLFQFKWSKNYHLFEESFKRLNDYGMERIFGNPLQDQYINQMVLQLKSSLQENREIIDHVKIYFIFNGDIAAAERSATLDYLRETLESKKYLVERYFGRQVDITFEYESNAFQKIGGYTHTTKVHQYPLQMIGHTICKGPNSETMRLGFVSLMDLYGVYCEMKSRFFERNIRAGLSPEKLPNRALRQAFRKIVIDETESPAVFAFNHNGVTMFAENLEENENTLIVTEPRLLNGAQTITSLAKFLEEYKNNPAIKRNEARLRSIQVLAKIIWNSEDNFVVNVTVSNNKQNPVDPWNLRANDSIQLRLHDKFADLEPSIFYERQENSFESLTDTDLEELGIEQHRAIKIKQLAQTFLAIQGETDRISRLTEVFGNEKTYSNTFRESYIQSDSRKLLLCYKIQFRLSCAMAEVMEKGPQKYVYVNKARNLVWALLIQGILNDPELQNISALYGIDLRNEAGFTQYLRDIASKKIRPILDSALSNEPSQKLIKEENYSFLRSKDTYNQCMVAANKLFGWKKKWI